MYRFMAVDLSYSALFVVKWLFQLSLEIAMLDAVTVQLRVSLGTVE